MKKIAGSTIGPRYRERLHYLRSKSTPSGIERRRQAVISHHFGQTSHQTREKRRLRDKNHESKNNDFFLKGERGKFSQARSATQHPLPCLSGRRNSHATCGTVHKPRKYRISNQLVNDISRR